MERAEEAVELLSLAETCSLPGRPMEQSSLFIVVAHSPAAQTSTLWTLMETICRNLRWMQDATDPLYGHLMVFGLPLQVTVMVIGPYTLWIQVEVVWNESRMTAVVISGLLGHLMANS